MYLCTQLPCGHALVGADSATHFLSDYNHRDIQVITTLPDVVRHRVDLAQLVKQLVAKLVVFVKRRKEELAFASLFFFKRRKLLTNANRLCHKKSCICFYCHEFSYVRFLVNAPILVELFKEPFDLATHFLKILDPQRAELISGGGPRGHYCEMQVLDGLLELQKCLEEHVALLEDQL